MQCFLNSSLVFLLIVYLHTVNSHCRQSYITICDSFEDFKVLQDTENIIDLMIGSENGSTNMVSVDLMKTLQLNKFHKLKTLTILGAINGLKNTEQFYECRYVGLNLQHMILYGNVLKTIGLRHFPATDPLKRLSLVNNQIESLEQYAFVNNDIEYFDLSDNLLELIKGNSFPQYRSTKVITLRNNKLAHIEPQSFPSSLETLHLDKNKLRYIADEVLYPLVNLKEFTLSHNYLKDLPKIENLTKLVKFDISYNTISSVKKNTFKDMSNLRFLDLSNNRIHDSLIFKLIYTPQTQPNLTLSLAFNVLEELDVEGVVFQNQTLVLYGNPWNCEKWYDLKEKLAGHESQCDQTFSARTGIPYCVNNNSSDIDPVHIRTVMLGPYVGKLNSTIKKSGNIVGCVLEEKKYEFLFPKFFYCGG